MRQLSRLDKKYKYLASDHQQGIGRFALKKKKKKKKVRGPCNH